MKGQEVIHVPKPPSILLLPALWQSASDLCTLIAATCNLVLQVSLSVHLKREGYNYLPVMYVVHTRSLEAK